MNKILLTGVCAAFVAVSPAMADPANLLGVFQNWQAYTTGSGSQMTCYALSQPRASQPRTAKRSPIYLMVSDYPGRHVKGEAQIVFGYAVKDGAPASLAVGGDKFAFFARNTGKEGSAWIAALGDSQRMIDAMRGGVSVVAAGISARGTKTSDTYSLAGFGDALAKVHAACNM